MYSIYNIGNTEKYVKQKKIDSGIFGATDELFELNNYKLIFDTEGIEIERELSEEFIEDPTNIKNYIIRDITLN